MKAELAPMTSKQANETNVEWNITYMQPLLDDPFESNEETFLKAVYYGTAMNPTIHGGERLLLRKCKTINEDSEIYMVQYGREDNTIVGRLSPSKSENNIHLSYDTPKGLNGVMGQELKKKYIIGIWRLISSSRIHEFILPKLGI